MIPEQRDEPDPYPTVPIGYWYINEDGNQVWALFTDVPGETR